MHKSLIDYARDYLSSVDKPQGMDTIFEEVRILSGLTDEEFLTKKAQFYSDFTLCSNFIYCGNGWDLKERQPDALFDCDSSFFIDPKERKKIIEKRKLENAKKEDVVNVDSVSGYEGVEEYVVDEGTDDSYDDPTDTFTVGFEEDYEEDYEDDYEDDEYDNILGQYEDLYDEE